MASDGVSPKQLKSMSDNVLQLITTTMPHMDPVSTGKYNVHVITCNFVNINYSIYLTNHIIVAYANSTRILIFYIGTVIVVYVF